MVNLICRQSDSGHWTARQSLSWFQCLRPKRPSHCGPTYALNGTGIAGLGLRGDSGPLVDWQRLAADWQIGSKIGKLGDEQCGCWTGQAGLTGPWQLGCPRMSECLRMSYRSLRVMFEACVAPMHTMHIACNSCVCICMYQFLAVKPGIPQASHSCSLYSTCSQWVHVQLDLPT